MVEGISWIEAVFITAKVHISSEAVCLYLLSLLNSSMALSPRGVAALPIPRRFAVIFIDIADIAGEFFSRRGKSR